MNQSLVTSLGYVRVAAIAPHIEVADVMANVDAIIGEAESAIASGVEIAVFPELCITGYTCGDLFRQQTLLDGALKGLDSLRRWSTGVPLLFVVGLPMMCSGRLYNVAAVVQDGEVLACIPKTFLPNSQEYYELRWFASGRDAVDDVVFVGASEVPFGTDILIADSSNTALTIGIEICEDLWSIEPPSGKMAREGATLILNCSASNEIVGKPAYRANLVRMQSARTYTSYVYASAGPSESTTDMIFGGHCMVAECGEMIAEGERLLMEGACVIADVDVARCVRERANGMSWSQERGDEVYRVIPAHICRSIKSDVRRPIDPHPFVPSDTGSRAERCREILNMQGTALAMRAKRSGATSLVLGISGGLDSTLALLVCLIACNKLQWQYDAIVAISMPGFGTTGRTATNARVLGQTVGASFSEISIVEAVSQHFKDIKHDSSDTSVVFENAQARVRTQILMDVANKHSGIVVGTGDLSEIALGWSTYNADHMSMYNPNAGVPKTLVRHLISWYADEAESGLALVLRDVLATPISPELLPTGKNGEIVHLTEVLIGPYEVHDFFLHRFVRMQESVNTIAVLACLAFENSYSHSQIVGWLDVFLTRFFANQFKRSAMPDGVKVGSVALSPRADWRMPSDASVLLWRSELNEVALILAVELRG